MKPRTERHIVASLRERFRADPSRVLLGIGDDAAVLAGSLEAWVSSVDTQVDGVHFDLRFLSARDVGYRAFHAAASDLAAMGATPAGALSALILPRGMSGRLLDELLDGQAAASAECGCPIIGGNLSRGRELSVTTTVMGRCARPLRRDTARPGDELWLVGDVGLAALGLSWLRLSCGTSSHKRLVTVAAGGEARQRALERCAAAWRRPRALLAWGRELSGVASAAIDVSDGLAADGDRLARASGVRLVVQRELLRAALHPALVEACRALGRAPLQLALRGGEDYALLATGSRSARPAFARRIGYVARGLGARLAAPDGQRVLAGGFDHLAT